MCNIDIRLVVLPAVVVGKQTLTDLNAERSDLYSRPYNVHSAVYRIQRLRVLGVFWDPNGCDTGYVLAEAGALTTHGLAMTQQARSS